MAKLQYGICYNPTWTGWSPPYKNNGPAAQFSDTDFFSDSFEALWHRGTDASNNVFRNDMDTLGAAGFTLLRLYNWGPTRGWANGVGSAHLNFLYYARQKGMQVAVPVSNYFLCNDQYAWNAKNPSNNYAFSSAPDGIQQALMNFLGSVTDPETKKLHSAVHSFSVGNELDYHLMDDLDGAHRVVDPTSRFARAMWWVVNLQRKIKDGNLGQALVTVPISNGDQGNPGTTPPSSWFQAFVNGVKKGVTPICCR